MLFRPNRTSVLLAFAISLLLSRPVTPAQGQTPTASQDKPGSVGRYIDQASGRTADDLVEYGLSHNLELQAARKEIDAAKAMVKQARLRANPKIDIGISQNVTGTDHTIDVGGMLPLELGGRRPARITVAEREGEVREHEFVNRERLLAREVRVQVCETLAQSLKRSLTDERVESYHPSLKLVA